MIVKGNPQLYALDYVNTFSPVAKMTFVRVFVSLIAIVLNINRVSQDIGRYFIFCLLPIRYEKIVRPYRLQQKTADI